MNASTVLVPVEWHKLEQDAATVIILVQCTHRLATFSTGKYKFLDAAICHGTTLQLA